MNVGGKKYLGTALVACVPFIFLAITLLAVNHVQAREENPEEIFYRANQAYRDGRFQAAIEDYLKIAEFAPSKGHLYYNLGNAYFKEGQTGMAILYYERAKLIIPRDADLNFNLRHALDQTKDVIHEEKGILGQALFWIQDVTFRELLTVFAIINLILWLILGLRLFIRPEWTYYGSIIIIVFWVLSGVSFGAKWHELRTDNSAVIIKEEVKVMAGPDKGDTLLFKLHEGSKVRAERKEDGWTLIRLSQEKRGWVKSDYIGNVNQVSIRAN